MRAPQSNAEGFIRDKIEGMDHTEVARIALFLDFENLAIGVREALSRSGFEMPPLADALAERGRVVFRRAYADWSMFERESQELSRHHVELVDMPQRKGQVRKNAADIKMAVDAVELALERTFISTFAIGTGDSDFTPLVHKLRALDKRVIGVGVRHTTSKRLPPACDEFLFYDDLVGTEPTLPGILRGASSVEEKSTEAVSEDTLEQMTQQVTSTLAGLQRSTGGEVVASALKMALRRKDPTFSEADYGFRTFSELLRYLETEEVVALMAGPSTGDPVVMFAPNPEEVAAFNALVEEVKELSQSGTPYMSGLKDAISKQIPGFTEKRFGYGGFLQFIKAAHTQGLVEVTWDEAAQDYIVRCLA